MTLAELNEILAVQRVKVADQTRNCEQLLTSIGESTDIAMEKKQLSEEKRREIEDQRKIINKEQTEARQALAEAQPALDAARMALAELEKADITEIRYFPLAEVRNISNKELVSLETKSELDYTTQIYHDYFLDPSRLLRNPCK